MRSIYNRAATQILHLATLFDKSLMLITTQSLPSKSHILTIQHFSISTWSKWIFPLAYELAFITKIPNRFHGLTENIPNPLSDYFAVLLILNNKPPLKVSYPFLTSGIINWNKFQSILNKNLNLKTPLKSENDIDIAVHSLTNTIQTAAWNSRYPKLPLNNIHISIQSDIKTLIILKKWLRAIRQRTKYPFSKNMLNKHCNSLKTQLSKQREPCSKQLANN